MNAPPTSASASSLSLMPPLTKKVPGSIENSYAAVAITVSHVDVAIAAADSTPPFFCEAQMSLFLFDMIGVIPNYPFAEG